MKATDIIPRTWYDSTWSPPRLSFTAKDTVQIAKDYAHTLWIMRAAYDLASKETNNNKLLKYISLAKKAQKKVFEYQNKFKEWEK